MLRVPPQQVIRDTIQDLNKHNAKRIHTGISTKTEAERLELTANMYKSAAKIPAQATGIIKNELKPTPKMSVVGKIVNLFRPFHFNPHKGAVSNGEKKAAEAKVRFKYLLKKKHPATGEARFEIMTNGVEKTRKKGIIAPIEKWMSVEEKDMQTLMETRKKQQAEAREHEVMAKKAREIANKAKKVFEATNEDRIIAQTRRGK